MKRASVKTVNGFVITTAVIQLNAKRVISAWRTMAATSAFVRTNGGTARQMTAWRNASRATKPYRNVSAAIVLAVNGTVRTHVPSLDARTVKPLTTRRIAKRVNVPKVNGSALQKRVPPFRRVPKVKSVPLAMAAIAADVLTESGRARHKIATSIGVPKVSDGSVSMAATHAYAQTVNGNALKMNAHHLNVKTAVSG